MSTLLPGGFRPLSFFVGGKGVPSKSTNKSRVPFFSRWKSTEHLREGQLACCSRWWPIKPAKKRYPQTHPDDPTTTIQLVASSKGIPFRFFPKTLLDVLLRTSKTLGKCSNDLMMLGLFKGRKVHSSWLLCVPAQKITSIS